MFIKSLTSAFVVAAAFTNLDMEAFFEPFGCLKILSGRKISAPYEMGFVTHKDKQLRNMILSKMIDFLSGLWLLSSIIYNFAVAGGIPSTITMALIPFMCMVGLVISDLWVPILLGVIMSLKFVREAYIERSESGFTGVGAGSSGNYEVNHMDEADDEKYDGIYNIGIFYIFCYLL